MPFWLRAGPRDVLGDLRVVLGPAEDVEAIVAGTRSLRREMPNLDGEVEASGIPLRC